nr:hypothetical protein Iba_chr05aCG11780 [Ipomoea batatas]
MNRETLHFDSLVASEFPLEVLDLQHPFVVQGEYQARVVPADPAIDRDDSLFPAHVRFRGVQFPAVDVLSLQHQGLGVPGRASSGFGENDFAADENRDVKPGYGFGARPEFGPGEIPENTGIFYPAATDLELLGSLLLGEHKGLDSEMDGRGAGERGEVEIPGRGLAGGAGIVEEEMERLFLNSHFDDCSALKSVAVSHKESVPSNLPCVSVDFAYVRARVLSTQSILTSLKSTVVRMEKVMLDDKKLLQSFEAGDVGSDSAPAR